MAHGSPNLSVSIHRRLRPLRLGFLVKPTDRAALMRIIEMNTCLWGGRFNFIIPLVRTGVRYGGRSWSSADAIDGYTAQFEPDFIVDTTGVGKEFFSGRTILGETAILDRNGGGVEYGLGVWAVYRSLYEKKFRFQRRHPEEVVLPSSEAGRGLLTAAAFGRFPFEMEHLRRDFQEVFEPSEEAVTASNLHAKLLALNPLEVTTTDIDARRRAPDGVTIFILNGRNPLDVIDFWNLRALGWRLVPFPLEWEEGAVAGARKILHDQSAWYRDHPNRRSPTAILPARSVDGRELSRVVGLLAKEAPGSITVQGWFPPLWNRWSTSNDIERCTLSANEDEIEAILQGSQAEGFVNLPSFTPAFVEGYVGGGTKWATVLSAKSRASIPAVAPVVPTGLANVGTLFRMGGPPPGVMGEGVVVYGDDSRHLLRVPDPTAVARSWFEARGFSSRTSSAGKVALSMVRAMGGLWGAGVLAYEPLIKKLNAMSHGEEVENEPDGPRQSGPRRRVRPRSATREEIFRLLYEAMGRNSGVADRRLERLLETGVFRVGVEVPCPECAQASWFPLDGLGDNLRCQRCLSDFTFPAANPAKNVKWTFRTQGAFSVENFAQGAYAVVLALRFLDKPFADTTWVPSTLLTRQTGEELEADFVAWQRPHLRGAVATILGECKSFGDFGTKDFTKAKTLGLAFPGAYQFFVKLGRHLTAKEKKQLVALAKSGRRPLKGGQWRTPVVILTGTEVFSDFGPPDCWSEIGAFERAAKLLKPHGDDLLQLAKATQLAYLGLEPEDSPHQASGPR